ncbi:MAG: YdcF family protein [Thermodesulfobacteriota bacterium]|nr:MAG: YdcF family protein [Thermodesulfobacteriota bacterium]
MKFLKVIKAFCYAFTATGVFFIYTPAANWMVRPLVMDEQLESADLVVVLGGGAYANGSLSAASAERLIRGLLLYKKDYAERIIFSGGTINDPKDRLIHSVTGLSGELMDAVEGTIMADIARGLGMDEAGMAVDKSSTNTYENLVDVQEYMAKNGLKSCLLVTSPSHMYRAWRVAKKLGLDCSPAPVADNTRLRNGGLDRIGLARESAHEYAGLAYYWYKGYI